MKKIMTHLTILALLTGFSFTAAAQAPAGFTAGFIITPDGTRQEGFIKEQFKGKAAFVFQPNSGKKQTLGGNAVNEVNIGATQYISYANDFFKVVTSGSKAVLLQKVSDATGKVIYNGSEAAGISSGTEGKIGDYFIRISGTSSLVLINKDNLNKQAASLMASCPAIATAAAEGKLEITNLDAIVSQYNSCK